MPLLLQKAAAHACLAALAASQACTPDWGKCGWQASSLSGCCSPQFACEQKNQWYWQCVQAPQPAAPTQPPPPAPAPPLPSAAPAPEPEGVVKVDDQLRDLETDDAAEVADEVARLSKLAADLSAEGQSAAELASQMKRPAGHSAAEVAAEAARLSGLAAKLKAKTEQMAQESAAASKEALAASERVERFSGKAEEVARVAAKLPGADKPLPDSTGGSSVKVLVPSSARSPQPAAAADAGGAACPDDADLQACISWCNKVSPGSQPTLAGNVCSKMGTKELDFGMLPSCECYDGKMESVLKSCTSSCKGYGGASGSLAASVVEGVKEEMAPRTELPIDIAVLYSTHCPACRNFISHGLAQLMSAGLPGREVNVSLLPMDAGSAMARAQLCAMRQTQLRPMSVDGPSLKKGLDYLVCCDLAGGVDRATAKSCAQQTGFDWAALEQCANGPDGREMAMAATRATSHVQELLKGRGFVNMPGIPWVFVQGTLLRCSGTMCAHEILPAASPDQQTNGLHEGGRPLAAGGGAMGFVKYVCSRLSPQPLACQNADAQNPALQASSAPQACENCFSDLGHSLALQQGGRGASISMPLLLAGAGAAAACAALLAAAVRVGVKRRAAAERDQGTFSPLAAGGANVPLEDHSAA